MWSLVMHRGLSALLSSHEDGLGQSRDNVYIITWKSQSAQAVLKYCHQRRNCHFPKPWGTLLSNLTTWCFLPSPIAIWSLSDSCWMLVTMSDWLSLLLEAGSISCNRIEWKMIRCIQEVIGKATPPCVFWFGCTSLDAILCKFCHTCQQ